MDNMSKTTLKFNASDVLGAICLEAKRIVLAGDHFAAGASFPEASKMQAVIDRMHELNDVLLQYERTARALEAEAQAKESLVARGSDAMN